MQNLETQDWWPELLRQKDTLSLKQLAERFGTTAGAISAALRRVSDGRSSPSTGEDDLPPEAGADENEPRRRGSKDALLFALMGKMGTVPDNEIAREASVSLRTVASFRARHRISAYDGPRRRQTTAAPAPATGKAAGQAWLVSFRNGQDRVVLADSIQKVAETVGRTAEVVKVSLVGTLL